MKEKQLNKWFKRVLAIVLALSLVQWGTMPVAAAGGGAAKLTNFTLTANSEHANTPISKAQDGDTSTFWETNWKGTDFTPSEANPIVVTATFQSATEIGKMKITPRQGTNIPNGDGNGRFKKADFVVYNGGTTPVKTINWAYSGSGDCPPQDVVEAAIDATVTKIEIKVYGAYKDTATMAELEFFAPAGIGDIDTSLIDAVKAMGLTEADTKGWSLASVKVLLTALAAAEEAAKGTDVEALEAALTALQTAFDGLGIDTSALEAKIQEAKELDLAGKSSASVANLKRAIAAAEKALTEVKTPEEVAFEILQLENAMELKDTADKEIQTFATLDGLERENNFNGGWLFKETDTDSKATGLDESQFSSINLPHDFSITKEFTTSGEAESAYLKGGTGWYRKHVVIPASEAGKNFTLIFDGSYMDTEVYVNGEKVGENHNGYNQFAFDITELLTCDGTTDNVIAVKVVNPVPTSRWYSGSGIYRDVTLQVTEQTHVDYLGMIIATPTVTAASATVKVTNKVVNADANTTVTTALYDKNGEQVGEAQTTAVTDGKSEQTFTVSNPELWTVKGQSPALYKAVSTVNKNGKAVDTVEDTFGLKEVRFERETGFWLNGENMKLKGVCMHHDQGALGASANYHAVYRQMKIMKDMGVNSIRVTHNPAAEALLKACDELGLLVINEAFDGYYYAKNGNSNDFARWFKKAIGTAAPCGSTATMTWAEYVAKQMVRVSRNHASILMYSVGNEITEGSGSDADYPQTAADVCSWFAAEDSYHKPTIGDNKAKNNDARTIAMCQAVSDAGGIVGLNYTTPAQYTSLRNAHTDWIIYGSETSSANHSRGVYNTTYKDMENLVCSDYENEVARVGWGHSASTAWKHVEENPWNAGEFVWTGFDYLGEPTPWNGIGTGSASGKGPVPRSSFFGIVETTGFEKDIYYLYQSLWNDNVHTHHMTKSWNDNLLKNGNNVTVQVFTDAAKVELYLNNEKIATKTRTDGKFDNKYFAEFSVEYTPGTITSKVFDEAGQEITDGLGTKSVTTSGAAAATRLTADKTTLKSDGYDLSYITVDVLDADGNFVPDSNKKLYITVEGNGAIVGTDNGNQADSQTFRIDDPKNTTRNAFNGKALIIVQSEKRAGEIKVHVKGSGLAEQTITLDSVADEAAGQKLVAAELVSKYAIIAGEGLTLPKTVTGIFANGKTEEMGVTWETGSLNLEKAGSYTVRGKINGADSYVTVSISVYGDVAAVDNYSTVMHEGQQLILPATRNVYYANGALAGEFPVTWRYFDASEYTQGNTYKINGTVICASKKLPVTATIRVVEPLPERRNLARLTSDMPTLAQSCTTTADNLNSLNNGVIVNQASNERWTDWGQQADQIPWVSYTWQNSYQISELVAYIYQDANSITPKTLEFTVEAMVNGTWQTQQASYITPIAYNDGDGKTTIALQNPVETNAIRLNLDKGSTDCFTGMTELEVFEYVPTEPANTDNELKAVKFNGVAVTGFSSEKESKMPCCIENITEAGVEVQVAPTASAVVLVDNFLKTVKIIVIAENGDKRVYSFNGIEAHTEVKHPAKAATCTTTGLTEGSHCSVCGTVLKTQQVTNALGHVYVNNVTKATTSKDGKIERKCTRCGDVAGTTVIPYPKTINVSKAKVTYNKKAQKPSVIVKDSKGTTVDKSNYTVVYKANKNVGVATVTITFKGNYTGKVTKTFQIVPKKPALSKVKGKKKGFTANWKKDKTITGYEVQYSLKKNFKKAKPVKITKNKITSKSIAKLKANKKYFVRLRTYKTVKVNGKSTTLYSAWSKAKTVKVKK